MWSNIISMQIIEKLVIPNYPDTIQMAKERRTLYYTKTGKKKIPKRYLNKEKYAFDNKGRIYTIADDTLVISNPRTAGKERLWVVNFQEIWNGRTHGAGRAAKVNKLKDIFRPYVKTMRKIYQYPVGMEIHLYNTEFKVDASNKGVIYTKIIEDLMTEESIIEDDSFEYINDTGRIILHKVETAEEIRMVVNIFKSTK